MLKENAYSKLILLFVIIQQKTFMSKNELSQGQIKGCQICSGKQLEMVLSLGHQPIVQEYLTVEQLYEPETTYPLNLCRCSNCGLLQLDYIVDPRLVFPKKYPYRTGLTNMLIRNFQALADELEKEYGIKKGDFIVDIGSNDGTLLAGFKTKGMQVLGVEPTDAAKTAIKNGIPTIQDYFNKQVATKIIKKYGPAKIITATNVFAHINNVPELVSNIKILMDERSVFVSESQYLMDIFEKSEFDTIYHEHLRFYSLKPLDYLFKKFGMTLVDAECISAAGGSIRVFAMKGKHEQSGQFKELVAAEEKAGIYNEATWKEFSQKALAAKNSLLEILIQCKKEGARVIGLTSSARSNTLLGFNKIDTQILDYCCEKKGSPKIGMFTPGTHIPVVDEEKLFKEQPEYVLVLSWHIGEELMKLMRKFGYKGKFIIPLPKPTIIS